MKWQPIETAPKDGTVIDLWDPHRHIRLISYRRVELSPYNVFYEPLEYGPTVVRTASHWMPQPESPEAA